MKKKVMFTVIVVLLLIVFGVSAFLVGSYLLEGKEQEDRYDQLAQIVSEAQTAVSTAPKTIETMGATEPDETTEPTMIPGYEELYTENSDMVGWLKIEGTKVNYPVMQTPDEAGYYLYRDFDKKDSKRGAIFAWETADINEPSDNITLFGHNMADGSMFAGLMAYENKSAWENNSLIFFDTLTEYHIYKIFAVFKTSANIGEGFSYHQFVDAETEEEFNEFVMMCKELSFYDTGITPKYGDKLICLSTCEYTLDNGRLVVAAVRIT
ncbi:MAG: class B sortase [Faecousia sp.]